MTDVEQPGPVFRYRSPELPVNVRPFREGDRVVCRLGDGTDVVAIVGPAVPVDDPVSGFVINFTIPTPEEPT